MGPFFQGTLYSFTSLTTNLSRSKGGTSSEWETLLDEWEQCSSHLSWIGCLKRAQNLRSRQPLPPLLIYREEMLLKQAEYSQQALLEFEREFEEALEKVEYGKMKQDVSQLSFGVWNLKKIKDQMVSESSMWTDEQIAEVSPHLEIGRQTIIQLIPEWLPNQSPRSDMPGEIGDFKHRMLKLMGGNLKALNLEKELVELENHTQKVIRNAEAVAEAKQLLRNTENWILEHSNVTRMSRVVELRALIQTGGEFSKKLKGCAQRAQLPEIAQTREKLATFIQKLKDCEDDLVTRSANLMDAEIETESDIEKNLIEIDFLINTFENLPDDLEDLILMRKMLRLYRTFFQRLSACIFSIKGGTRPPSPRGVNPHGSSPAVGRCAPSEFPATF